MRYDEDGMPPRRRVKGGGRPPHPVSAGAHDGLLISMAQQGKQVVAIAARLDCSADLVVKRLNALGEAVRT